MQTIPYGGIWALYLLGGGALFSNDAYSLPSVRPQTEVPPAAENLCVYVISICVCKCDIL